MTGLTAFILDMVGNRLASASPDCLAAQYGIRVDWARWYLSNWSGR